MCAWAQDPDKLEGRRKGTQCDKTLPGSLPVPLSLTYTLSEINFRTREPELSKLLLLHFEKIPQCRLLARNYGVEGAVSWGAFWANTGLRPSGLPCTSYRNTLHTAQESQGVCPEARSQGGAHAGPP